MKAAAELARTSWDRATASTEASTVHTAQSELEAL